MSIIVDYYYDNVSRVAAVLKFINNISVSLLLGVYTD